MNDDTTDVSGSHKLQRSRSGNETKAPAEVHTRSRELDSRYSAEPDVLLHVPELSVDEVVLHIGELRPDVALQAEAPGLLRLSVGAHIEADDVHVEVKGVNAQALAKVRLDKVAEIIAGVMATIDRNPEILTSLPEAVRGAGRSVAELGDTVLPIEGGGSVLPGGGNKEEKLKEKDEEFSRRLAELEEMHRASLKTELKQADPDFKVYKKHSDDDLRNAILDAESRPSDAETGDPETGAQLAARRWRLSSGVGQQQRHPVRESPAKASSDNKPSSGRNIRKDTA